jgi:hypothetical protein
VGYVESKLWEEHPPADVSLRQLPQPAMAHSSRVASFFSSIGILVAHEIIDGLTVTSYMGGTVLRTWSRLAPYRGCCPQPTGQGEAETMTILPRAIPRREVVGRLRQSA